MLLENLRPIADIPDWSYTDFNNQECTRRLRVFGVYDEIVCVVTETDQDTGASITNSVETISKLLRSPDQWGASAIVLEHYLHDGGSQDLDMVYAGVIPHRLLPNQLRNATPDLPAEFDQPLWYPPNLWDDQKIDALMAQALQCVRHHILGGKALS